MNLKEMLDREVLSRNSFDEVSDEKPDPILIARESKDEYISLICSLFAYGKASLIVKFLKSLDFELLNSDENSIKEAFNRHYYRFQTSNDVIEFFISLKRLKNVDSLQNIFLSGYRVENSVIDGIYELISAIHKVNSYESEGYKFLIGSLPNRAKIQANSPYKRWNMFLRWMVRADNIDFGIWSEVNKADLILPLDTHTFKVSQKLGLLNRKSYDLKSALIITEKLKEFDPLDPIKYDFAIYRLGQEMKI